MSSTGSPDSSYRDRIARATGLIRALTGVLDASVEGDAERIRSVTVVAEPALSPWEVTRNIQSALLASMGLPIERAIIEVRRPDGEPALARPEPAAASQVGAAPAAVQPATPAARGNGQRNASNTAANGARIVHNGKGNGQGAPANGKRVPGANGNGHGAAAPVTLHGRPGPAVARLDLETRGTGRIVCRAVIATRDRIAVGEAEGPDTPAGRLEAAARAVLEAAPAAATELEAVREIELAGRRYVVVAVRRWSDRELAYKAEVAPVDTSPEAAAAHAALGTILQ